MDKYIYKNGRPSDYTPEIGYEIAEYVRNGLPFKPAAAKAGIYERKAFRWLKEGRDDIAADKETDKSRFYQMIEEARAKNIENYLQKLENPQKFWQAHSWILERVHREEFAANAADIKDIKEAIAYIMHKLDNKNEPME